MTKKSAAILLYRFSNQVLQVFLVHPGGPFFAKKDLGAWSIPKGEFMDGEDPLAAAKREFEEETGFKVNGHFMELTPVKLKSGKTVFAWALEGNINAAQIKSNTFLLEWLPKSGKMMEIPEVDKGDWFTLDEAKQKINNGQIGLLEELEKRLRQ